MSSLLQPRHLAAAHLAACAVILAWDLYTAARTARIRTIPAPLALVSGVGGLLLLPALVVLLVSDSFMAGRALYSIAWVWPLTTGFIALQAVLSVRYRLAAPPTGWFIAAYDLFVALVATSRYALFIDVALPAPFVALVAAERDAIAFAAQPLALLVPWFLYVPIFAPVTPGRAGPSTAMRAALATLAAAWTALLVIQLPAGVRAVSSYDRYAAVRLQERPDSDFTIGVKVFPALDAAPPRTPVQNDLALADSIGAGALSIYVRPAGSTAAELDSLARALDRVRGDKTIIVALDLSGSERVPGARAPWLRARVADAVRIARRVHPDWVVPVLDPVRAAAPGGALSAREWIAYLNAAAAAVHGADTSVRVMMHVGGFGRADSTLFAWAASSAAPVDGIALSLFPGLGGAATLDARLRTADRWLRALHDGRPVWVLESGGFPLSHGAPSQARAIWGTLAWATSRPAVKGLVVYQAGDYGSPTGLRSAGGRLRLAALTVRSAVRALGE